MDNREYTTASDGLDALLAAHLRSELDGQRGRAEARFRAETLKVRPRTAPMLGGMWGLWVAGAMAASVGIVWGVGVHRSEPLGKTTAKIEAGMSSRSAAEAEPAMVGAVTQYQTIDEGAVLVEDAGPARRVRREVLETLQWYDQQSGADIEVTIPHEQVVFVGMPAF